MPELSTSVDSASEDELPKMSQSDLELDCSIRSDSASSDRYRGKEKHMTPINLAKIMVRIERNKLVQQPVHRAPSQRKASSMPTERVPAAMAALSKSANEGSEPRSTHSVVRGFSPSRISQSYRSSTNMAADAVIVPAPVKHTITAPAPAPKKNKPVFYIGSSSSSSSDDSEESYSSFKHCKRSIAKKTSFSEEVSTRTLYDDDALFSDDDGVSESAIEDDDLEWESSSESGHSSYEEGAMFKRVESRPQLLTSRRSLLSTMLHEPERAAQLASVASRSTPAFRRSNSPREPPTAFQIKEEAEVPGSKPILSSNGGAHPPALSPRTTRRNMLATELTESLRKHLLWERQQKNTTASAHLKRRHTAADVTKLVEYPQARGKTGHASKNNSWNNPFDEGNYEYHAAGW